jgi:hypothetical protein
MAVDLRIAPMMRIAKPGNQRCDRRGVFLPCTGGCEMSLRVN